MQYEEIDIPIPLPLSTPIQLPLGKDVAKRARLFCEWFAKDSGNRVQMLERAVNSESSDCEWIPDRSIESLDRLGAWLKGNVVARELSLEEMRIERGLLRGAMGSFADAIQPSRRDLTKRSYSMAIDVAIYLSQAILVKRPELEWKYILNVKKHMDRNLPVLIGFRSKVTFSPINATIGIAWGFINGEESSTVLRTLAEKYIRETWD